MVVDKIEAAVSIYDLQTKANHFKKKEGTENTYAIRVNIQYRLEFLIEWDDKGKGIVEILSIEELSKHYE